MICVHKYLTSCKTNPQPPGFADFIRGTITLFKYCKLYNYELAIDNQHPLFNYLENNKYFVTDANLFTFELIPSAKGGYEYIDYGLNKLFENRKSFSVLTNGFYTINENGKLLNWGIVDNDCKNFLKSILVPREIINTKINNILISLFDTSSILYDVIHIRFGDSYLHNQNKIDILLCENIISKIKIKLNTENVENVILLTDSKPMALNIKKEIPKIRYYDNFKIHMGDLRNFSPQSIEDTLVDFFIMTKAKRIFYVNHSGFSQSVACIYDIPYIQL